MELKGANAYNQMAKLKDVTGNLKNFAGDYAPFFIDSHTSKGVSTTP